MNIPSSTFNVINLLIILIVIINIFLGYKKGLMYQVLTLLSFIGAFLVAYLLSPIFSEHIALFKTQNDLIFETLTTHFLNNLVWFILILIVAKLIFSLIIQISKVVSKLPLIGFANKILGALFGLINGAIWIILFSTLLCTPVFKNGQQIRENTLIKPFNEATNQLILKATEMINFDSIEIEYPEYDVDALRNQVEQWLINEGILNESAGN